MTFMQLERKSYFEEETANQIISTGRKDSRIFNRRAGRNMLSGVERSKSVFVQLE
jgi:hypothetical protein